MKKIKRNRSWSKPDDVPNLIARKKVDWSIFVYGSHIPLDFHEDFEKANNNIHVELGTNKKLELIIEGKSYEANFANIDRKNVDYDTYQIRYDSNSELKELMKKRFSTSYQYLKLKRESSDSNKQYQVPENKSEFIEFYETEEPFKYEVKLITIEYRDDFRKIWWVNQGKTLEEEKEAGILWAPIETKNGRSMYHWETMQELKEGDIVVHYANGSIRYVSEVLSPAVKKQNPTKEPNWNKEGRLVKVEYYQLKPEINLDKFNQQIKHLNIDKGPINKNDSVNQGYLFNFNKEGLSIIQQSQPETKWPDFAVFADNYQKRKSTKEITNYINQYIENKGFSYPLGRIENFYLSLKTKPFVLLAGISGTGKTKLVKLFAEAINCNYKIISVRPDWSDSSDLLGYKNIKGEFQPGPMIDIIKKAKENPDEIYFVCLDEMNLARVEYYFSDFLSIMETRRYLGKRIITDKLLTEKDFEKGKDMMYADLIIPENLYIIGTVNMDETTHPFSKKVLDRANTIEFSDIYLREYNLNNLEEVNNRDLGINNDFLKSDFITLSDCGQEYKDIIEESINKLEEINDILQIANLQVGYRVRDEVCFYMINNSRGKLLPMDIAFDYQLMQKILPRIQGSSETIKKALIGLFYLATGRDFSSEDGVIGNKALAYVEGNNDLAYPGSAAKIAYMIKRFEEDGFTAYWL